MGDKALPSKKTKIVCTIGPASNTREKLIEMIRGGMNIARINFAHGDLNSHKKMIDNVRYASTEVGKRVAILGDLPGPKMRIGKLETEPVFLQRGQTFILQTEEILGNVQRASLSFDGLPKVVKPGDKIYINDGYT